jgi:hypothetical protein
MESKASSNTTPVQARLIPMLLGYFVSKGLLVSAQLNIAEHVAKQPATAEELGRLAGVEGRSLYRLLRALASIGIFQEDEKGCFSNTELSNALRNDVPGSLKSWALTFCEGPAYSAWDEIAYSIQTGKGGFEKLHGSPPFAYMTAHPQFGRVFDDAMTALTAQENASIHEHLNLADLGLVVDIGGGNGSFLLSCLQKNAQQRGVLFDRPDVLVKARELVEASGFGARCELVPGDFFGEVPSGADCYLLKYILHDWSDEQAITILKNVYRASRMGTKLVVMDMLIGAGNGPSFAKMVDLWALVFYGGGRERTRTELSDVLRSAGFRITSVAETNSFISVIEAERQ